MKQSRKPKLPLRLNAKPTQPHSTPKGVRGYDRRRANAQFRAEIKRLAGTNGLPDIR